MKFSQVAKLKGASTQALTARKFAVVLSVLTVFAGTNLTLGTHLAANAQAAANDPSQKHEKEQFKADSSPPDMVVDERTEMEMLRDLGDSLKTLEHSATETIKEVNRHAPAPINNQDVIDAVILDPYASVNPMAGFDPTLTASLRKGPVLPPRKKWLDFDVTQLASVVGILQHEVSSLCPPVAISNTAKDSFKVELSMMAEANNKIQTANDQLKTLAQGPTYDNEKIGKTAHDIRLAGRTIEECRKRAAKALSKK